MNKYWLFDSAVRRSTEGAKIIPGKISKDERNPLFTEGIREIPALPWEVLIGNGYPNVFYDPYIKKYRCYYTCYLSADHDNSGIKNTQEYKAKESRITGILYAESEDGIHWLKPALGAIEYAGSSANNIVALNTHGAGVFLDAEEKDPEKRYKIITRDDLGPLNIQAAFSADGIHFKNWQPVIDDPRYPGDTHNFVIRDPRSGAYLLYTRTFVREIRTEARLVSDDFIHWTEGTVVLRGADADDQVYAMPVFYQDGLYWGLAEIFYSGDASLSHFDHVEVELCYSADGIQWQRIAPGVPFIPNGADGAYDFGICYTAAPVFDGLNYRFYYMGGSGTHYSLIRTGLCLGTVDRNRLAGVASRDNASFIYQTRKLKGNLSKITLCADADEGIICFEALDEKGNVIPGFSKNDCVPLTASHDRALLKWNSRTSPDVPFMLKFYCENAVLYSILGDLTLLPNHPL